MNFDLMKLKRTIIFEFVLLKSYICSFPWFSTQTKESLWTWLLVKNQNHKKGNCQHFWERRTIINSFHWYYIIISLKWNLKALHLSTLDLYVGKSSTWSCRNWPSMKRTSRNRPSMKRFLNTKPTFTISCSNTSFSLPKSSLKAMLIQKPTKRKRKSKLKGIGRVFFSPKISKNRS